MKNSERLILNPLHIFSKVAIEGQVLRVKILLSLEYGNFEEIVYKDNVMDFISCGDYVLQDNTLYIAYEKEISEVIKQ